MLKKLKKLKQVSLAELFERTKQGSHLLAERLGVSSQVGLPNDTQIFRLLKNKNIDSAEKLLEHFRTRKTPGFFPSFANTEETVAELRRRFPDHEPFIIKQADKILRGEFDLLGFENLRFSDGPIPDWHYEPIAKINSPKIHWSKIEEISAEATGDKKIIWELNRHQYFATLGQAYLYSQDEIYAQIFAAHLQNWLEENPPKLGVNWLSSLELAFRAMSWLWAIYFFKNSPALTPELFLWMLKSLNAHARHIETYLSTYFSPNTHLTGEALGLFFLGTLLPEFKEAEKWKNTGEKILLNALNWQIRDDGVYVEQATAYHRYTADFYSFFLCLANSEKEFPKIEGLFEFLLFITQPDGKTPLLGDDDGGRFLFLDEFPTNDFRPTLAKGAILFERGDFKFAAENPTAETLWLFGAEGLKKFDKLVAKPPQENSKAFETSGFYVLRDGWEKDSNFMLIDCGIHGFLNCGHAHADALSFVLSLKGRNTLVDSGTFCYTSDAEKRRYFRSSEAHNAVTVDNQSSSISEGTFQWITIANVHLTELQTHRFFDFLKGQHDGFESLGVRYEREFLFLKDNYFVIADNFESAAKHDYAAHFHFAPNLGLYDHFRLISNAANSLESRYTKTQNLYSSRYGLLQEITTLNCHAKADKTKFFHFLLPNTENSDFPEVEKHFIQHGDCYRIDLEQHIDWFVIGHGKYLEAKFNLFSEEYLKEGQPPFDVNLLKSDFTWTWARFNRQDGKLLKILALNGHNLSVNEQYFVAEEESQKFVLITNLNNAIQIETASKIWTVELKESFASAI